MSYIISWMKQYWWICNNIWMNLFNPFWYCNFCLFSSYLHYAFLFLFSFSTTLFSNPIFSPVLSIFILCHPHIPSSSTLTKHFLLFTKIVRFEFIKNFKKIQDYFWWLGAHNTNHKTYLNQCISMYRNSMWQYNIMKFKIASNPCFPNSFTSTITTFKQEVPLVTYKERNKMGHFSD